MLGLVPTYLLKKLNLGETRGMRRGCAICVDVSGFTPLVERLGRLGRRGAEMLSEGISALYAAIEQLVDEGGGFVSTFAGDSFSVVLFDEGVSSGQRMSHRLLEVFRRQRGLIRGSALRARAGVAAGQICWRILGN